jgi:3-methyladenine DNA glycosylase AlkC
MAERLKDMFFTRRSLTQMAKVIEEHYPAFEANRFVRLVVTPAFEDMELKQKMRHVTICLHETLPKDYPKAIDILMRAAPHVTGFEAMCLPDYIEVYGLEHWELSLPALAHFTRFASAEFAIRPFIAGDPKRTIEFLSELAESEDPNVRRFASEGCRPRLPWAMALPAFKKDPGPILPVLERLKVDDSEFVRKSVANNLNDISKDHPRLGPHHHTDGTEQDVQYAGSELRAGHHRRRAASRPVQARTRGNRPASQRFGLRRLPGRLPRLPGLATRCDRLPAQKPGPRPTFREQRHRRSVDGRSPGNLPCLDQRIEIGVGRAGSILRGAWRRAVRWPTLSRGGSRQAEFRLSA